MKLGWTEIISLFVLREKKMTNKNIGGSSRKWIE